MALSFTFFLSLASSIKSVYVYNIIVLDDRTQ